MRRCEDWLLREVTAVGKVGEMLGRSRHIGALDYGALLPFDPSAYQEESWEGAHAFTLKDGRPCKSFPDLAEPNPKPSNELGGPNPKPY